MRQKTADLVKLLNNHRERIAKKMAILRSTLSDAEKRDTKVWSLKIISMKI